VFREQIAAGTTQVSEWSKSPEHDDRGNVIENETQKPTGLKEKQEVMIKSQIKTLHYRNRKEQNPEKPRQNQCKVQKIHKPEQVPS